MAATMMASMAKAPAMLATRPALLFRPASRGAVRMAPRVQAVQSSEGMQDKAVQLVALSTLVGSFMSAGNAAAATELGQIAAGDNRFGTIALLFAPVVGWVLFNIGGPALNQLNETASRNKLAKRNMAAGLGLSAASLLAGQSADAAEIAQVAAGDNRIGAIALLFAPVIGWVLFNIGGPALNQLNETASRNKLAKRSVAAGLGLTAASMLAAQSADAAEIAQVAAGDNRIGAILLLFAPVVGWVLFNIGGPALNQLNATAQKNKGKKRGVAAGLGLTAASMFAAQNADAAEALVEAAQKVNDNRFGIIATVFVPVLGWVAYNIYEGAKNQVDNMRLR